MLGSAVENCCDPVAAPVTLSVENDTPSSQTRSGVRRGTDLLLCVVLVVASLAFCAKHVSGHDETSPIDEYMYIDYYAKVLDHGYVKQGERTGDYARRYLSCHPNRVFGAWQPQLCGAHRSRPDASYPFDGKTWANLYTPLYFLTVRVAAEPLVWAGVDFVQAGRYATGLWLVLGVILLYLVLRRLKVHPAVAFAASLTMSGSLAAYWSNTYISTDATGLAAGAGMLWATIHFLDQPGRRRAFLFVAAAVFFAAFKIQNLEAVAVVAVWLVLTAWQRSGDEPARAGERLRRTVSDLYTRVAVGGMMAGAAVQAVWLAFRAANSLGPDPNQGVSGGFSFAHAILDMTAFLPGVAEAGLASPEVGPWGEISVRLVTLVVVGGVIGLAAGRSVRFHDRALAVSVLFASLVAGPALSFATIAVNHLYVPLVARYGIPIMPGMLASAALMVPHESRVARASAVVVAVSVFCVGLAFRQT